MALTKLDEQMSEMLNINSMDLYDATTSVPQTLDIKTINDKEFARENIINLINKGNSAIDNLLAVARESNDPKAFEAIAKLLINLSQINKDLLNLKNIGQPKDVVNNTDTSMNVEKAVIFSGTTNDFVEFIHQYNTQKTEETNDKNIKLIE